jgi:hypothetical protein
LQAGGQGFETRKAKCRWPCRIPLLTVQPVGFVVSRSSNRLGVAMSWLYETVGWLLVVVGAWGAGWDLASLAAGRTTVPSG